MDKKGLPEKENVLNTAEIPADLIESESELVTFGAEAAGDIGSVAEDLAVPEAAELKEPDAQQPSIGRQFFKYALPAVIGMVSSALYTIVDGIFVGRGVGPDALAAVNIAFPFIMVQIAATMLMAVGGANLFSILRGRGEKKDAHNVFTISMIILVGLAVILNAVAVIFPEQLCRLLSGGEYELAAAAAGYLRITAAFGFVYMPGLGLSIFVRNDRAPGLELLGTLSGAVTNIILDWLFIMKFGWGIEGAAIATGIGQMVSVVIFGTSFLRKKRELRIVRPSFDSRIVKRIFKGGFPSFLSELSQSLITLSYNIALTRIVGDSAVAAYSVVMYVCSIINMTLVGIVQGAQPIMSYNHGSGKTYNVNKIYRMAVISNLTISVLLCGASAVLSRSIVSLFITDNADVADMARHMMWIYFLAMIPSGVTQLNVLRLQTTEREKISMIISLLRCGGFLQLFLVIFGAAFGFTGLCFAYLSAECCNLAASFIILCIAEKKRKYKVPADSDYINLKQQQSAPRS